MPICIISEWDVASLLSGSCLMCSRELQWVGSWFKNFKKKPVQVCAYSILYSLQTSHPLAGIFTSALSTQWAGHCLTLPDSKTPQIKTIRALPGNKSHELTLPTLLWPTGRFLRPKEETWARSTNQSDNHSTPFPDSPVRPPEPLLSLAFVVPGLWIIITADGGFNILPCSLKYVNQSFRFCKYLVAFKRKF